MKYFVIRVSRKDLFDGNQENISDNDSSVEEVHDDFEIVDVNDENIADNTQPNEEPDQEFDFPLFSFGGVTEESTEEPQLMKVSLNEELEEIVQERPKDYYFAQVTEQQRINFEKSAITYDDIQAESNKGPNQGWKKFRGKVIDLSEYNRIIEKENAIKVRNSKRRPGKKQRLARKLGSQKVEERKAKDKELKKMKKKMFHKRGGKKNKKKAETTTAQPAKPKFRTE